MNFKSPAVSCLHCKREMSQKGLFTHFLHKHSSTEDSEKMLKGINQYGKDWHVVHDRIISDKRTETIEKYNNDPKQCKYCDIILDYSKRGNKFCSSSCACTFNNLHSSPNRKHGPRPTKPKLPKKVRIVKLKIIKPIRSKSTKWENNLVGKFSPLYRCKCRQCNTIFMSRRKQIFCIEHLAGYKAARTRFLFSFNIYKFPDLFDVALIEQYGWYSPGNRGPANPNGISRDHKVSISESIKNDYDPYYITHPLNCELMRHSQNKSKYMRSSIEYSELVTLVNQYEMAGKVGTDPNATCVT